MNNLIYHCPNCGETIAVSEDSDEYILSCPGCGKVLDLTELEPGMPSSAFAGASPSMTASPMSGNEDSLALKVRTIVADSLHRNVGEVSLESDFINDLAADSLDQAELVMALEDAFKCYGLETISEADAERFKRVGDVVFYLRQHGVTG